MTNVSRLMEKPSKAWWVHRLPAPHVRVEPFEDGMCLSIYYPVGSLS